jgi:hypothetical protein
MSLVSSNNPHVLYSLSDVYEPPQRLHDKKEDWKGADLKSKKLREPAVKVIDAIETKPTDRELYENTLKQLEKDSLELAELYVVKPPVEVVKKKQTVAKPTNSLNPLIFIFVAAGILAILVILNIIRRRK